MRFSRVGIGLALGDGYLSRFVYQKLSEHCLCLDNMIVFWLTPMMLRSFALGSDGVTVPSFRAGLEDILISCVLLNSPSMNVLGLEEFCGELAQLCIWPSR